MLCAMCQIGIGCDPWKRLSGIKEMIYFGCTTLLFSLQYLQGLTTRFNAWALTCWAQRMPLCSLWHLGQGRCALGQSSQSSCSWSSCRRWSWSSGRTRWTLPLRRWNLPPMSRPISVQDIITNQNRRPHWTCMHAFKINFSTETLVLIPQVSDTRKKPHQAISARTNSQEIQGLVLSSSVYEFRKKT